jgi:hypothetical protein
MAFPLTENRLIALDDEVSERSVGIEVVNGFEASESTIYGRMRLVSSSLECDIFQTKRFCVLSCAEVGHCGRPEYLSDCLVGLVAISQSHLKSGSDIKAAP